jgi:hypothetical protein
MVGDVRETGSLGMKLKLLERLRRSRDKHKLEYLEQTSEREETEHIHDKFEDEIVEGRSPSMSRLQTLVDVKETSRPKDQAGLRTDPRTASEATTPNGPGYIAIQLDTRFKHDNVRASLRNERLDWQ